jgi:SAM-dependent methyltransferase
MSTSAVAQAEVDRQNSEFWNELCGTSLARNLGISDFSKEALQRFDHYYFDLYPYLDKHIRFDELRGKDVLEIGLGYGTVSQRVAECARYTGLDIAKGPVEVVNLRISMNGLSGHAVAGSVLDAPFPAESFDAVITIGCLHHTGNLPRALSEVHRVLRPGGRALVMVYNAFSYRRWLRWPRETWRRLRGSAAKPASESERAAYDASETHSAPETVFTSKQELREMCAAFKKCEISKENAARELVFSMIPRPILLPTVGPLLGLDLSADLLK